MPVTREQIQRLAALAELTVDDAAAAELEVQLSQILDYVRRLEQLDAAGAAPADARAARLREDVVAPDPLLRAPPDFAVAMQEGLFVVPRLGEMGGAGEGS